MAAPGKPWRLTVSENFRNFTLIGKPGGVPVCYLEYPLIAAEVSRPNWPEDKS